MKKIVFILAFLYSFATFAQVDVENDDADDFVNQDIEIRAAEKAIILNMGYNIPILNNNLIKQDFWNKKVGMGIDFSVDFRQQFMKTEVKDDEFVNTPRWFAVGAGLGVSHLRQSIWFDQHKDVLTKYKDNDGDTCDVLTLDYKKVREEIALTYLDVPIYLEIGKLNRERISGFFKFGVKASVLVSKEVKGEGLYTANGKYDVWGCLIHGNYGGIPELGFYTDVGCYSDPKNEKIAKNEYKLSPFVLWGSVSGGVNIPFSGADRVAKVILRVSAKIDYSITPISKAVPDDYFEGASFRLYQSNMLGGDGTKVLSVGGMIGLIFCL